MSLPTLYGRTIREKAYFSLDLPVFITEVRFGSIYIYIYTIEEKFKQPLLMVMPDSWSFSQPFGFVCSQGDISTVSKTELHLGPNILLSYCNTLFLMSQVMGDITGHPSKVSNIPSKSQTPVSVPMQQRTVGVKKNGRELVSE